MTTAALIDMPYRVQRDADDLTIILSADAADHPALPRDSAADLIEAGTLQVVVDAAAVKEANSVLICWLVRLATSVGPGRLILRNLAPRAKAMFLRMRLDQVMILA